MLLEKICEYLGVEIGEEWTRIDGTTYMFDDEGYLHVQCEDETNWAEFIWEAATSSIPRILIGELKPIWKPVNGEKYYAPDIIYTEKYTPSVWRDRILDYWRLENGLVFKTKEEAIKAANKLIESLKKGGGLSNGIYFRFYPISYNHNDEYNLYFITNR